MEFHQVMLIGPANVYFDGRVSSRTFFESDGQKKTLGFVMAGKYTFSTQSVEHMQILGGELEVKLPGEAAYIRYESGAVFDIPAGVVFGIRTDSYADYCCTYLPA